MSFILDALRKSESERQRGKPPGLADVRRAAHAGPRRLWLLLLAIVLIVNLVVLALIWRGEAGEEKAVSTPATGGAGMPSGTAGAPGDGATAREVRPLAREPVPRPASEIAAPASTTPPTAVAAPVDPVRTAPAVIEPALPRADELIAAGRLNVAPLNLDLHVYSELAVSRFVFINSVRYREGERLQEGPLLESITSTGVILRQGEERFILSRH